MTSSEPVHSLTDVVEALRDLTRVMLVLSGRFASKSEAARKLDDMGIAAPRIAHLLGIPAKDVSSLLIKAKKKQSSTAEIARQEGDV